MRLIEVDLVKFDPKSVLKLNAYFTEYLLKQASEDVDLNGLVEYFASLVDENDKEMYMFDILNLLCSNKVYE